MVQQMQVKDIHGYFIGISWVAFIAPSLRGLRNTINGPTNIG